MKTTQLFLMVLAFILINTATQLQSQNLNENEISFQDLDIVSMSSSTIDLRSYEVNIDDYKIAYSVENAPTSITQNDAQVNAIAYALSMAAFGLGFGFNGDQTLWCLHAEYYYRLAMLKRSAVYGALGVAYNGSNSDFVSTSLIDITLKVLMFAQLVKQFQQVRFLYGLAGGYGFGKEKFEDGFTYDITRLTIGIVLGFQIMMAQQWALMIQTNVFNYQEQTRKYEDFETKTFSRWGLINKRNLLAFSLVYTFANSKN
ncbi:hypothetical protein [Psychroserpens jangbogonensis]|uniref:hypothetical protein n=1 Tax=Psychroserpens jangbogonensis TaxID=1484460 RepID=UPI00053DCAAA|nr:hypothetical protein [Psychroserpens jangbogonensis]